MTKQYSICFEIFANNQEEAENLAKKIEDKYSLSWNMLHLMTEEIEANEDVK